MKTLLRRSLPSALWNAIHETRLILRALPHIGLNRHCPCCGWHFRRFLWAHVHPRPDARCPRCDGMERHRLVWLFLQKETNLFRDPLMVMHVAPEFFFQKKMRALPNLNYVSVDIDLKTSLAMQQMDITNMNRPDQSVDVFLCSHVLEHIPDDRKAMKEIFRVLKKNGWALLQVPIDEKRADTFEDPSVITPEEREKVFGQKDHVRTYGRDYVNRLKEAGFTVHAIDYMRQFPADVVEKHRLATDEKIYFCTRPNGPRPGFLSR